MPVLDSIVASTRARVRERRARLPEDQLLATAVPREVRSLKAALGSPGVALIAEIKRASPSAGDLDPSLDVGSLGRTLAGAGAAALSVLTEPEHFKGSLEDLAPARGAGLPVLRKDFLLEPYQVVESFAGGADAILLIVRCLGHQTSQLLARARELGLEALVEVFDEREMEIAVGSGAEIIGINSRDLDTLHVDPRRFELRDRIPPDRTAVALSGVATRADLVRVQALGMDAVLVGEALMRSRDPASKVAELLGTQR